MVLKPTEKTPLAARAGTTRSRSRPAAADARVITGDPREIADEMLTTPTSTSSPSPAAWPSAKYIAVQGGLQAADPRTRRQRPAGGDGRRRHRRQGGRPGRPTARTRTAGQRCTAVKRIFVHEKIAEPFTEALLERTKAWNYGDPLDLEGGHGHRDRRSPPPALRAPRQRRRRPGRAAAARQPRDGARIRRR